MIIVFHGKTDSRFQSLIVNSDPGMLISCTKHFMVAVLSEVNEVGPLETKTYTTESLTGPCWCCGKRISRRQADDF